MTPQKTIETLSDKGIRLWLAGERLKFSPIPGPALVDEIRTNKTGIVSIIRTREVSEVFRVAVAVISILADGPDRDELVRAFDGAPDKEYPHRLASLVVSTFQKIDQPEAKTRAA